MRLALMLAPQRNALYSDLVRSLAPPELLASPLGPRIEAWDGVRLGGQDYLLVELDDEPATADFEVLARLGTVAAAHEYFARIGEVPGPLLRPLELPWDPFLPPELVETRRYRGKTNEIFTAVLLNLALFAGDYRDRLGERLRVLDPLAGGGTTLFVALTRGYDAVGIELEQEDVTSTDTYVRQFLRGIGVPFGRTDERLRGAGRRYVFSIGRKGDQRTLALVHGDTYRSPELLRGLPGGARFHAVVADLPYGIQHRGRVAELFARAVPTWAGSLLPGGALALAWDATGLPRAEAIQLVRERSPLDVLDDPPYSELAHRVDRVIKRRDVLVARNPD